MLPAEADESRMRWRNAEDLHIIYTHTHTHHKKSAAFRYLTGHCQSFIQRPIQFPIFLFKSTHTQTSPVWVTVQEGRLAKTFDLEIKSPKLVLYARNICIKCVERDIQVERERERQQQRDGWRQRSEGHCEPREKANDLSRPRCTVSLR